MTSRARPAAAATDAVVTTTLLEVAMSTTQVSSESTTAEPVAAPVPLRLEVVTLPVSDVERAKSFYQRLGWRLDADFAVGDDARSLRMTPPDSGCPIHFGKGVPPDAVRFNPSRRRGYPDQQGRQGPF